jgi:hypothetical protein
MYAYVFQIVPPFKFLDHNFLCMSCVLLLAPLFSSWLASWHRSYLLKSINYGTCNYVILSFFNFYPTLHTRTQYRSFFLNWTYFLNSCDGRVALFLYKFLQSQSNL